MRLSALIILSFVVSISFSSNAYAGDPMILASNGGTQVGKAKYCGFQTERFALGTARAIDHYSTNNMQRGKAMAQFMLSAKIAMKLGPVVETCSEFRVGYEKSLSYLKQAGF